MTDLEYQREWRKRNGSKMSKYRRTDYRRAQAEKRSGKP